MKLKYILTLSFCLALLAPLRAEKMLADLDFRSGNWEMVGVSLHNAVPVQMQQDFGTFICRNLDAMRDMQRTWDFRGMYQDYCDHHYVLKFYKDRQLVKTLKVNLHCRYITDGVMSYEFDPQLLAKYQPHYVRMPWSFIQYNDLGALRRAVNKIQSAPNVYLYQDVRPLMHDGFFVIKTERMPWHAKRDSVLEACRKRIANVTGSDYFHITPYVSYINDDYQIEFRFEVFCSPELAARYINRPDVVLRWRPHLMEDDDKIMLTVVGLDREQYRKMLYGGD